MTSISLFYLCFSAARGFSASLVAQAIAVYANKYEFASMNASLPDPRLAKLTEITEEEARSTFSIISEKYGESEALQRIVQISPLVLWFNASNIGPALSAYADILGIEAYSPLSSLSLSSPCLSDAAAHSETTASRLL